MHLQTSCIALSFFWLGSCVLVSSDAECSLVQAASILLMSDNWKKHWILCALSRPQKIIFHALFVRESQLRHHIHARTLRLEWTRWASAGSQGTAPSPTAQTWVSRKFEKGSTAEILTSHSSCRFLQFKNQPIFYSGCLSFCFLLTWKFRHPLMKNRLLEGFDIRMWWDYTTCP